MKIIFDLDDVVADFMTFAVTLFGVPSRWDIFYLPQMYPHLDEDYIWGQIRSADTYRDLLPMPGAREGLDKLSKLGLDFEYATARPAKLENLTLGWLERYDFPNRDRVTLTSGHDGKVEFIRALQPFGLVEDRGHTLLSVQNYISEGYLFDRPWNSGFKSQRRIISWNHLVRAITDDVK